MPGLQGIVLLSLSADQPLSFRMAYTNLCSVRFHCYQAKMQEKIKKVMHYAGPRVLLKYPYLTLMHGVDSLKRQSN